MANLSTMSAAQIEAHYNKLQARSSALGREMIDAGRGYEKPSETRTKSDPLAKKVNAISDELQPVIAEMDARRRYHGNLKPIHRVRAL
jgi:hypothetical protein